MKLQHFVSVWYTHMHTQFLYTRLPGLCFIPSSEHSKWDLFNNPLCWYCRTSALPGHEQLHPHGGAQQWVKTCFTDEWSETVTIIIPLPVFFLQNSVHCLICIVLVPSPSWSPQHQQWQEVFFIPGILHVSLLAALRLCKHSDRSYLRDYLSIAQLHSWTPLLLLRVGLAVVGMAGQLGP